MQQQSVIVFKGSGKALKGPEDPPLGEYKNGIVIQKLDLLIYTDRKEKPGNLKEVEYEISPLYFTLERTEGQPSNGEDAHAKIFGDMKAHVTERWDCFEEVTISNLIMSSGKWLPIYKVVMKNVQLGNDEHSVANGTFWLKFTTGQATESIVDAGLKYKGNTRAYKIACSQRPEGLSAETS